MIRLCSIVRFHSCWMDGGAFDTGRHCLLRKKQRGFNAGLLCYFRFRGERRLSLSIRSRLQGMGKQRSLDAFWWDSIDFHYPRVRCRSLSYCIARESPTSCTRQCRASRPIVETDDGAYSNSADEEIFGNYTGKNNGLSATLGVVSVRLYK